MKLILLLKRRAWCLEYQGVWYRLQDEVDINTALYAMPLSAVDETAQIEQTHIAGTALVQKQAKNHVRVLLNEPDGAVVADELLCIDETSLVTMEWMTPPFKDGWINAATRVRLEGVRQLEIKAYLPKVEGSESKTLHVTDETTGTTSDSVLSRNTTTTIRLAAANPLVPTVLRLDIDPEKVDEAKDPRKLGFVLIGESIEAA